MVATSCGNGDSGTGVETGAAAPETTASETTAAPAATAPQTETTSAATGSVGPPAPDFTLQLASGGDFVLSQQTRPVVVIFWAEW